MKKVRVRPSVLARIAFVPGILVLIGFLVAKFLGKEYEYGDYVLSVGLILVFLGVFAEFLAGGLKEHQKELGEESVLCVCDGIVVERPSGAARISFEQIVSIDTDVFRGKVVSVSLRLSEGYTVQLGGSSDLSEVEAHLRKGTRNAV